MTGLAQRVCEPCRAGAPGVAATQRARLLEELPGWDIVVEGGVPVLHKTFPVKDFAAALDLANRIGAAADAADHHPRLVLEWGRVSIAWWTHAIGDLHLNDFIMAARTNALATD